MILQIKYTTDKGTSKERIVFSVVEEGNIGFCFVFNAKKIEGGISAKINYPFWFPDKDVKVGDLVVLYTKAGKSSFRQNKDNTTTYFYYRDIEKAIFTDDDRALLVESHTWEVEN